MKLPLQIHHCLSLEVKRNQNFEDAYNKGVRFFDASPGYGLIESLFGRVATTEERSGNHYCNKMGT